MKASLFEAAGIASANMVQIAGDVAAVEKQLQRHAESSVNVVQQVLNHTLDAGGKRLRPVFLILSARATGLDFSVSRAVELGACMEMIHMATLIHDDVIDESATRRGRPTASSVFGNTASILSGDVYLAKAMSVLASDGDIEIIRTASRMVVEMAEGEAREVELRGKLELDREEHFRVLRMKTAAFVECCCLIGGMMAEASAATVNSLAIYGHHLGIAFQIADDVLDYRGQSAQTGKPKATDFREGCATLPLIELCSELSPGELEFVSEAFGTAASDEQVATITHWMRDRGAFDRSMATAQDHLNQAMSALALLPDTPHRELLRAAGHFVLKRNA